MHEGRLQDGLKFGHMGVRVLGKKAYTLFYIKYIPSSSYNLFTLEIFQSEQIAASPITALTSQNLKSCVDIGNCSDI